MRAGFREHAVYTYAYRDVLAVEVQQQQQPAEQPGFCGSSSSSSSAVVEQEVWVKVRQPLTTTNGIDSSSSGSMPHSKMLVLKGVESCNGSNTIAEFLRLQMRLHGDSSESTRLVVHAGLSA